MGFFSWNCRGCGHPLLSQWATNRVNDWMREAVVVESEGRVIEGTYDGYGRLDGQEINHQYSRTDTEYKEPGCWHRACWVKAGKPTDYAPSESSSDQGYFFEAGAHDMEEPRTRTWTVRVTRTVIMDATFSVEAEDRDAAYDAAEERAVCGDFVWEDRDPRGEDGFTVQDVEEEV